MARKKVAAPAHGGSSQTALLASQQITSSFVTESFVGMPGGEVEAPYKDSSARSKKKSSSSSSSTTRKKKETEAVMSSSQVNLLESQRITSSFVGAAIPGGNKSGKQRSKMKRLFGRGGSKKKIGKINEEDEEVNNSCDDDSTASPSNGTAQHQQHQSNGGRSKHKQKQKQPNQMTMEQIAIRLQADIEVRDRKHHLKTYHSCFAGSDAVDYLLSNDLSMSRSQAVEICQEIMSTLRTFEHASTRDYDFRDESHVFYRFRDMDIKGVVVETVPNYTKLSGSSSKSGGGSKRGSGGKGRRASEGDEEGEGWGGGVVKMDKYGFLLDDERAQQQESDISRIRAVDAKRWEDILDKSINSQSKIKNSARRGLPDSLRQKAWTVLTGVDLIMAENTGEYDILIDRADEEWERIHDNNEASQPRSKVESTLGTIERDLHRTFPKHYLFVQEQNDDGGGGGGGGGKKKQGEDSMNDSERSSVYDSSDHAGSDDEGSHEEGDDDDIVQIADDLGHDPAWVVESKKQLFNESMNASMSLLASSMNCGPGGVVGTSFTGLATAASFTGHLQNVDGIGLARVEGAKKNAASGRHSSGGDNLPYVKKDTQESAKSDESLDIFEGEEEDSSSGSESDDNGKSQVLGMGHGHAALRRVLRAYSMYDTDVGYCQGMNFIAAMFLTFLSEEEAFWLLVVVMNEEPYKLRELFGEDMAGTHEVLYIAEKLIAQFLPKLSRHIEEEGIHVSMFVTQWLLTVYTSTFPFDLVARVWDCFLVEGWKVVYRVMLSLLDHASRDILDLPFEQILNYFRELPLTVNGQEVMADSLKISLKRKHIQRHVNEWRRHAGSGGGGNEKERTDNDLRSKIFGKRRDSEGGGDVPMRSNALKALISQSSFPRISPFGKKVPQLKEVTVENISEQLLPIFGASKFAIILHNVLSPEECTELIDRAEENGFEDASLVDQKTNKAHRNCKRHVAVNETLANIWFGRIQDALQGTAYEKKFMHAPWITNVYRGSKGSGGRALRAVSVNERLRLLKYKQGQYFHSHKDAEFVRGLEEGQLAGERSYVSVQVYLNHKFKGGTTRFHGQGRHYDVKPRTGSILLFEHDLLHEGRKVTSGKKYIVRTDVMYSVNSSAGRGGGGYTSAVSGTTLTQQL